MELAIEGAVKYTEYKQNKGVLIMKRVICAVAALVMVLALAACGGGNGPKDTVKAFCEGLKAYDMKKVSACMAGDVKADEMDLSNSGLPESISKQIKQWASKLSYKIGDVREEGGKAYVDVTFSYTDASAVFGAAIKDYFAKAMAAAMSGQMDQEAMSKLFQECLETAAKENQTATGTASVTLELTEMTSGWKISKIPEEVVTVATFNILSSIKNLFGQ